MEKEIRKRLERDQKGKELCLW